MYSRHQKRILKLGLDRPRDKVMTANTLSRNRIILILLSAIQPSLASCPSFQLDPPRVL
jgi:hypothetical protein